MNLRAASACFLGLLLIGLASSTRAGDLAEGNAADWGTFASDNAAVSVSDETNRIHAGSFSLRLDTASGFDTGVKYPRNPTAHWDVSTNTHLVFWSYGVNTNDFQGNQPVVVLNST